MFHRKRYRKGWLFIDRFSIYFLCFQILENERLISSVLYLMYFSCHVWSSEIYRTSSLRENTIRIHTERNNQLKAYFKEHCAKKKKKKRKKGEEKKMRRSINNR